MLLPVIAGALFAAIFQFSFGLLNVCQTQRRLNRRNRGCWFKPGGTEQLWRNMISGATPEETWKKNFRLTREKFMDLAKQLCPYISLNLSSPNYRALSTEKKLAITLYYLKDTGSLGMTANTFGIALNTTSVIIAEVCESITKYLQSGAKIIGTTM